MAKAAGKKCLVSKLSSSSDAVGPSVTCSAWLPTPVLPFAGGSHHRLRVGKRH